MVFLADRLEYFQSFDDAKVCYDDGQQTISHALHEAPEYEISAQALPYRRASPFGYRLSQVAGCICAIELTALKFGAGETTSTDEAFFGLSMPRFKRDYLKKVRSKLL